jgi:hypothetical protein
MKLKSIRLACAIFAAALGLLAAPPAKGDSVLTGTDYFATAAALFDFGGGIGAIVLTGAFGPAVADVAITRIEDASLPAVGSSDTIDVELRMFELRSVAPVFTGGSFFDVFVHLDPVLASTGTMTISHEFPDDGTPAAEGTYSSSVTVNLIVDFVPIGGGAPFSLTPSFVLATSGPLPWSHEPSPGAVVVPGAPGDLDANAHAPLPAGFDDFFPLAFDQTGGGGILVAEYAADRGPGELKPLRGVPEPASAMLMLCALALLARRAWRTR